MSSGESQAWNSQIHIYGRTFAAVLLYQLGFEIMLCSLYLYIPKVVGGELCGKVTKAGVGQERGKVQKQNHQGLGSFPGIFLGIIQVKISATTIPF